MILAIIKKRTARLIIVIKIIIEHKLARGPRFGRYISRKVIGRVNIIIIIIVIFTIIIIIVNQKNRRVKGIERSLMPF